jgi:type I restriction enzyme S subunit
MANIPFYTSSGKLTKTTLNTSQVNTRALIFGTGGKASIHFADGRFSVSTDCFVASSRQEHVNIKFAYYYLIWEHPSS